MQPMWQNSLKQRLVQKERALWQSEEVIYLAFLGSVTTEKTDKAWVTRVQVNNLKCEFKVDLGPDVTCQTGSIKPLLKDQSCFPTQIKLCGASMSPLTPHLHYVAPTQLYLILPFEHFHYLESGTRSCFSVPARLPGQVKPGSRCSDAGTTTQWKLGIGVANAMFSPCVSMPCFCHVFRWHSVIENTIPLI